MRIVCSSRVSFTFVSCSSLCVYVTNYCIHMHGWLCLTQINNMSSSSALNRASHGVNTQITGATIDWTIPRFSRLVDYLAGQPAFRSASSVYTKDSCLWYLSLTAVGPRGREQIVFNLCREITDSKNPECVCYGKICLRWKFRWETTFKKISLNRILHVKYCWSWARLIDRLFLLLFN